MTKEKTIQEHHMANEKGKKKFQKDHKRKINISLLIQAHRNTEKIEPDRTWSSQAIYQVPSAGREILLLAVVSLIYF